MHLRSFLAAGIVCVCAVQGHSQTIRLDDRLAGASVQASRVNSGGAAAEAQVWQNFFSSSDLTWELARGRVGYRNGDLIVKGEGSTPVLLSPKQPAIDWNLYQALEVRMSAAGGSEIKIRIGSFEVKQKLGPAGQYNVYRFELNAETPRAARQLGLMPTDSATDLAAIRSIRLIPKTVAFPQPCGRQLSLGKHDEYRNAIYAHSPSAIAYSVSVPQGSHLHFGLGVADRNRPVHFQVLLDGGSLYSKTLADTAEWSDADVDLSRFAGRTVKLTLQTDAPQEGAVALWADPILTGPVQRKPNILIYTIDTMRPDHASVYGYKRDTTPFLKKLAATGVVFEDCAAQSTWTKTSIASLMTSLYAFTHGIVADSDTIPPNAPTLAAELRAGGYVTASIVASPFVGRTTGLERGFDYLLEYPVVQRQHNAQTERGTDSEALNKVVFPWLDRHKDEPFFLYSHSTDPHAPYQPPPPFDAKFANPAETVEFDRAYAGFRTNHEYGGGAVVNRQMCAKAGLDPDRFLRQAMDRYDGEILHNDRSLELLAAKLKQLGILDHTLIVVLSDHGEEFWEHGWTGHGQSVYQELTHAALLMWNPRLLPAARRVAEPVQLIDVLPTLLDLAGLKTPDLAEGQSLTPLLKGQPFQRRGLVVSSRFAAVQPLGLVPENATDSFAVIDAKWKLIFRNHTKNLDIQKVELYDRTADRNERRDVASENPHEVETRMNQLVQWIEAQKKVHALVGRPGTTQLDRQTIDQLRSLGYLGGSKQ
jgi:arylsulfatase A-like enzyme